MPSHTGTHYVCPDCYRALRLDKFEAAKWENGSVREYICPHCEDYWLIVIRDPDTKQVIEEKEGHFSD